MKNLMLKAIASVSAVAALATVPAVAQQTAPTEQMQPQIAPVTDAEITKFVAANDKVNVIAVEMQGELQGVDTKEKQAEIQMKTEKKMVSAIQDEGMTPERYTEIIRLAQADPALAQKLQAEMEG
ncbi:DUF4168 domain-containing protein [Ponticaulis profundi]|uniref:DUF4168 domain-containing protein n=1 Tax=Ponticaulis profundi TaxID=2665222 RepID=A0ABW1SCG0_9PROT